MTDRIIEIAEQAAGLSVRHRQLVIRLEEGETTAPLEDIAVLVVAHARVSYTHSVLTGLVEAGGVCVLCGGDYLPLAMTMPVRANCEQAERFRLQAAASQPLRKRTWQQIVRAKIRAQARTLEQLARDGAITVRALEKGVASGDPANVEAQAARRYWRILFGEKFRRDVQAPDQNRHLNYGYAVLRAVTARALCAAGLHPSFGLHHHNRYNAFALADDLMEPYRVLVDEAVAKWVEESDPQGPLDQAARKYLLGSLLGAMEWEGEQRSLFDWMARAASSLVDVLKGQRRELFLPEL
ncbi:MAG TPA: type II CRISPR-associated endonuclease Cas1 [Bryobacterales bacterium]|nr:type II CRISPR-associated endonuclease Cas1 [Bryobacterales bacterium]